MNANYWHPKGGQPNPAFVEELRARAKVDDIDALKAAISKLMEGRSVSGFALKTGQFVYRLRRLSGSFSKDRPMTLSELSYPPAAACSIGRLNRAGRPVFYCSTSKSPLLYELNALVGQEFVLSIWQLQAPAFVNNIGYTRQVFASLGSSREPQLWGSPSPEKLAGLEPVEDDYLSALFAEKAEEDAAERYKLSVAIAEIHYGRVEGRDGFFAGVLYPTVAGKANGDNLALLPRYVDTSLRLTKAIHLRVDGVHADSWSVEELDFARGVDEAGHLAWQGRSPRLWSPPAGANVRCVFKAGVDPLGDYMHGKDGIVGHWECSDAITNSVYCL